MNQRKKLSDQHSSGLLNHHTVLKRQVEVRSMLRQMKAKQRKERMNYGKEFKPQIVSSGRKVGGRQEIDGRHRLYSPPGERLLSGGVPYPFKSRRAPKRDPTKIRVKMVQGLPIICRTCWYDGNINPVYLERCRERTNEDGFEFLTKYEKHEGRVLKVLHTISRGETTRGETLEFLSLGTKSLQLWTGSGRHVANHSFKKEHHHLLQSVCYVPTIQIILGAAADMTVRVYDRLLHEVGVITTGERAFLHILWDNKAQQVVTGGVDGCACWRIQRKLRAMDTIYSLKQLRQFPKALGWISQMILVEHDRHVIVLQDKSLKVFDLDTGDDLVHLSNIHDKTLTAALWYPRSQYYLTGCVEGKIKIWASHYDSKGKTQGVSKRRGGRRKRANRKKRGRHALLHIFNSHLKSVTGFAQHPIAELVITSSLDGTIRIWNLDSLTLFNVLDMGDPLISLMIVDLHQQGGVGPKSVQCLCATDDDSRSRGQVLVYNVNSYSHVLGMGRGIVDSVMYYERGTDLHTDSQLALLRTNSSSSAPSIPSPNKSRPAIANNSSAAQLETPKERIALASSKDLEDQYWPSALGINDQVPEEASEEELQEEASFPDNDSPRILLQCGSTDVRLLHTDGHSATFAPFGALMEGLVQCEYSFSQQLLLCLLASGTIKVFCCRQSPARLLQEWRSPSPMADNPINHMCILDTVPTDARNMSDRQVLISKGLMVPDARGEYPDNDEKEILVIGCLSGELSFMDMKQNARHLMSLQAHNAPIIKVVYCRICNILMALVKEEAEVLLKAWLLPDLEVCFMLPLHEEPSCLSLCQEYPLICLGWCDGSIEMMELNRNGQPSTVEGYFGIEQHGGPVQSIDFHDGLQAFLSTGGDRILRIWDNSGSIIQKITLQKQAASATFVQSTGAIIVSQDQNVLEIPLEKWMPPELLGPLKKAGYDSYPFLAHHPSGYMVERKKANEAERKRRISLQSEGTRTMSVGPLVFKFPGSSQPESPLNTSPPLKTKRHQWKEDASFCSSTGTKESVVVDMEKLQVALKKVQDGPKQKAPRQWNQLPSQNSSHVTSGLASRLSSKLSSPRNEPQLDGERMPWQQLTDATEKPTEMNNQENEKEERHVKFVINFTRNKDKEKPNTTILDQLSSKAMNRDLAPPSPRKRNEPLPPSRPTSSKKRPTSVGRKVVSKLDSSCSQPPQSPICTNRGQKAVSFESMAIQGSKKHLHQSESAKGLQESSSPLTTERSSLTGLVPNDSSKDGFKEEELRLSSPTVPRQRSPRNRVPSPLLKMFGSFGSYPCRKSAQSMGMDSGTETDRQEETIFPDIFVDSHQKDQPVVSEVYQVPEADPGLTEDEMIQRVPGNRISAETPEEERQRRVRSLTRLPGTSIPKNSGDLNTIDSPNSRSEKKQVRFLQDGISDQFRLIEADTGSEQIFVFENVKESLTEFARTPENFEFTTSRLDPPMPSSLKKNTALKPREEKPPTPHPPRAISREIEPPSAQATDTFSVVNFNENPELMAFFDKMEEEQEILNLQQQSFRPSHSYKPNIFRYRELRLKQKQDKAKLKKVK